MASLRKVNGEYVVVLTPKERAKVSGRVSIVAPKVNTFYQNVIGGRVPCAYGSEECADKHFAPNGVGSRQHTTCAPGRAALAAR